MDILDKLQAVRSELRSEFIERDEVVDGALIALLAVCTWCPRKKQAILAFGQGQA